MIGEPLSKDWKFIGGLILLRLKKSGIEYVIFAKSSLLTLSGAQSRYGSGLVSYWRRTARDFSMIWTFLHLKSQNSLALGGISIGSEGSRGVSRGGRIWIFSRKGSDNQGNFRNRVLLRGVR